MIIDSLKAILLYKYLVLCFHTTPIASVETKYVFVPMKVKMWKPVNKLNMYLIINIKRNFKTKVLYETYLRT